MCPANHTRHMFVLDEDDAPKKRSDSCGKTWVLHEADRVDEHKRNA